MPIAARLEKGPALVREIAEMRVKVTSAGREQYAAWREGEHDDLAFAVALSCWGAKKIYPNPPLGDDGWWRRKEAGEWEAAFGEVMEGRLL